MYYLRSRYYSNSRTRFINTDSCIAPVFLSVGQNAFAYCCNDPANQIDFDGCLIWPGEIHHAVQKNILRYHHDITMEVWVTKTVGTGGRIDLFNCKTGEVWEVKPASISESEAFSQLEDYMAGTVKRPDLARIPMLPGGQICGEFVHTSKDGNRYYVTYYSPTAGVIHYQYMTLVESQTLSQPSVLFDGMQLSNQFAKQSTNSNIVQFSPNKRKSTPHGNEGQMAAAGAGVVALFVFMIGGSPCNNLTDCSLLTK